MAEMPPVLVGSKGESTQRGRAVHVWTAWADTGIQYRLEEHNVGRVQAREPYLFSVSFIMVFPRVEKTMKDIRSIGLKKTDNK